MKKITMLALMLMGFIPLPANEKVIPESFERTIHEGFTKMAQEPGAVIFTPPEGWRVADPGALPSSVKIMVVGKGQHEFPPSINLGTETYAGTLKQYLKTVKAINDSQGADWKDLGTIRTEAGDASLSQVDAKTEWGEIRMMHVILIKGEKAYILTAAALKEDFPNFYKDFFNSMRSLRINKDAFQMVTPPRKREYLIEKVTVLNSNWNDYLKIFEVPRTDTGSTKSLEQRAFESENFQQKEWKPFVAMLASEYRNMSPQWREHILKAVRNRLISPTNLNPN